MDLPRCYVHVKLSRQPRKSLVPKPSPPAIVSTTDGDNVAPVGFLLRPARTVDYPLISTPCCLAVAARRANDVRAERKSDVDIAEKKKAGKLRIDELDQ
ncbi:hypothetical protein SDJN02_11169, partial [Cucurbita argyrosperma subsp. argyrosperma]